MHSRNELATFMARRLAVLAGALLLAGCGIADVITVDDILNQPPYPVGDQRLSLDALQKHMAAIDDQYSEPRTPAKVAHSLETARAYESSVNGYDALWRGVRACAWLAANHPDIKERAEHAILGIRMGRASVRQPGPASSLSNRAEPYYYLALVLGSYCEVIHEQGGIPRAALLRESMENALMAKAIDERIDHAGPHRYLGKLMVETADALSHKIGTFEAGIEHLQRAVELSPDFAENRLFLAQALKEDGEYEAARDQIHKILESDIPEGYSVEHRDWLLEAQRLLAELPQTSLEESHVEEGTPRVSSYETTEVEIDGT
ncbi:MAG: tetratricopeptide repeat protein [Planctomycetes bacterium]|nr:tetratricopeptide repeat protein [Planctomycetota bacterium]